MCFCASKVLAHANWRRWANPSLQGQMLYTKRGAACLENMNEQINRLIEKATTLAAWVLICGFAHINSRVKGSAWPSCPPRKDSRQSPSWLELHKISSTLLILGLDKRTYKSQLFMPNGPLWRSRLRPFTSASEGAGCTVLASRRP